MPSQLEMLSRAVKEAQQIAQGGYSWPGDESLAGTVTQAGAVGQQPNARQQVQQAEQALQPQRRVDIIGPQGQRIQQSYAGQTPGEVVRTSPQGQVTRQSYEDFRRPHAGVPTLAEPPSVPGAGQQLPAAGPAQAPGTYDRASQIAQLMRWAATEKARQRQQKLDDQLELLRRQRDLDIGAAATKRVLEQPERERELKIKEGGLEVSRGELGVKKTAAETAETRAQTAAQREDRIADYARRRADAEQRKAAATTEADRRKANTDILKVELDAAVDLHQQYMANWRAAKAALGPDESDQWLKAARDQAKEIGNIRKLLADSRKPAPTAAPAKAPQSTTMDSEMDGTIRHNRRTGERQKKINGQWVRI